MFRALEGFLKFIFLVLSIQAVVVATDVNHHQDAPVNGITLPPTLNNPAATLKGPVVIANQASAVSANLRKKEEIEVDLEGVRVI
jgi:hypothetical protein